MISYVLPTRDRPTALARTLVAIGRLSPAAHEAAGGGEVIVIDNASRERAVAPSRLPNGLAVRVVRMEANLMAAARNLAGAVAAGSWLLMLDDDSYPLDDGHLAVIADAPEDVAAVGAEILLPDGTREAGGLPEVVVGCGALVRRAAFLDVGGYDPVFGYYAEEYDLCAKLIRAGWRIGHDFRFRVRHLRTDGGRDVNRMLHLLVRNGLWVVRRYAPLQVDQAVHMARVVDRCRRIAGIESALSGYHSGLAEAAATLDDQPRRAMNCSEWDRFTGAAAVRDSLGTASALRDSRVAMLDPGKNVDVIRAVLEETGTTIVSRMRDADAAVIGTLSPGPMLDGAAKWAARGVFATLPWVGPGVRPAPTFVAMSGSER